MEPIKTLDKIVWEVKIWGKMKSFQYYLFNFSVWKVLMAINEFYNQLRLEIFKDLQIIPKFVSELTH